MQKKTTVQRGFTLVEVIVVLVVLSILAAIAVPALTGYIDRANQKKLIVACRTCVNAAQTLASEAYGLRGITTPPANADVKALAEVPGSVSDIAFQSDTVQIEHLTYTEGADTCTYCANLNEHTEHYNFGTSARGALTEADIASVLSVMESGIKTSYDSGAALDTNLDTANLLNQLSAMGIDLAGLNAQSWSYRPAKTVSGKTSGPFFYWTDIDISTLKAGDRLPVMRYNEATGSYTVWEGVVGTADPLKSGTSYNIINESSKMLTEVKDVAGQTYDQMMEDYEEQKAHYVE